MADKKRVLILCTGNSARSQMAEGLRQDKGDRFEVESAGKIPRKVRPEAIAVMKELGIDISGHRSKSVDEFAGEKTRRRAARILPGHSNRLHHNFEDPAAVDSSEEERLAEFQKVRDEPRSYLKSFPPPQEP